MITKFELCPAMRLVIQQNHSKLAMQSAALFFVTQDQQFVSGLDCKLHAEVNKITSVLSSLPDNLGAIVAWEQILQDGLLQKNKIANVRGAQC